MAKFTKSRARKPIVEGQMTLSYSQSHFPVEGPGEVGISLRMGETGGGEGIWIALRISNDELDKIVEFRNSARERNK